MKSQIIRESSAGTVPAPLVIPALFWLAGLIAGYYFYGSLRFPEVYFIFFWVLPAVLFVTVKNRNIRLVLVMLLVLLAGMYRAYFDSRKPANHISHYIDGTEEIVQPVSIEITSRPRLIAGKYSDYYRLTGNVTSLAGYDMTGKVLVRFPARYIKGDITNLVRGSTLSTIASVRPYHVSPGFDRIPDRYFRSNSTAGAVVNPAALVRIESSDVGLTTKARVIIDRAAAFLSSRIDERVSPRNSGFIKAIILGERSDMQQERELLARAGMAHLLAISGLHIMIITFGLLILLKVLKIRRAPANIITILAILVYAHICGWTPSVSRAAIMISLYLLTGTLQRKPSLNNILFAALIIITAANPAQIFSIGLQFSFISVFVIINLYKPVRNLPGRFRSQRKNSLFWKILFQAVDIALLSFLISLFLAPLMAYYFNSFSFNGIIANLVGLPLMTFIIPVALLVILLPGFPLLVEIYSGSLAFMLNIMDGWAEFTSSLPLYFNFLPFSTLQVAAAYLLLALIVMVLHIVITKSGSFAESSRKWSKPALLGSFPLAVFLAVILFYPSLYGETPLLKVVMFDAGHGDIFLIKTPQNETILIDTGNPDDHYKHFSRSALPYLQRNGINTIDRLIITHPHSDHYGGFEWIVNNMTVNNVVISEHFYRHDTWQELREHIDFELTGKTVIKDVTELEDLSIENLIFHPDSDYYSPIVNDMSLVMSLIKRNFSILFTGDIEQDAELYLSRKYSSYLPASVLKVPHHGSSTSSTEIFLELVEPVIALIPSEIGGRRNLPNRNVAARIESYVDENLFIAGEDGIVKIKTDGLTVEITTSKTQRRKNIRL